MDENYTFISYSHADKVRVEALLHLLKKKEKPFWYDHYIPDATNWKEIIDEKFNKSSNFVLFLSNGIEQRYEIIRELKMAINRYNETDGKYKIYVVLLEFVSIKKIFEKETAILDFLQKTQYISLPKFGGITMDFLDHFINSEIWVDNHNTVKNSILQTYDTVELNSGYIYKKAKPEIKKYDDISFYALKTGETDPNTVYPLYMDNQWCPHEYYSYRQFKKYGFSDTTLKKDRQKRQECEIYRALLHNWQILVNRASIFNTDFFVNWYTDEKYKKSFTELLSNGSFVVYLMNENSPIQETKFHVPKVNMDKWKEICRKNKIYCIKMNWIDDTANRNSIENLLSKPFYQILETMADDKSKLNLFYKIFDINDDKDRKIFRNKWKIIRSRVLKENDEKINGFTREKFYKEFLISQPEIEDNITNCLLNYRKRFVRELKQIVDYYYTVNLPRALRVQPTVNYDDRLFSLNQDYQIRSNTHRVITNDEIFASILTFETEFLNRKTYISQSNAINPDIINDIRKLSEWRRYLEAVDNGRKRANLNEIDFFDLESVWTRYNELIDECKKLYKQLQWEETDGAVSVIYHIGTYKMAVVYRSNPKQIAVYKDKDETVSENAYEILSLDYICGDISKIDFRNNPFYTSLKLFVGVLADTGYNVYKNIISALKILGGQIEE